MEPIDIGGPYVRTAIICEKAHVSGDGIVSIFGQTDHVHPNPEIFGERTMALLLVMLVELVRGNAPAVVPLVITVRQPSQRSFRLDEPMAVDFGDSASKAWTLKFPCPLDEHGTHWFNLFALRDRQMAFLTALPLTVDLTEFPEIGP